MIQYRRGDLLNVKRGIIVHGVNTQSVMGAGVALAIRRRYPMCYSGYVDYIRQEMEHALAEYELELQDPELGLTEDNEPDTSLLLGDVHYYRVNENLYIANAFTQDRIGFDADGIPPADLDAISCCLNDIAMAAELLNLPVHMPKIGCGLGGLSWDDVGVVVEYEMRNISATCWEL